jgi:hypothetical protein
MKLATTLLAAGMALGIASLATPAAAANGCTVGPEHHNFFELNCGAKKTPWWWTPVRYKDTGGGTAFFAPEIKKPCRPPPCYSYAKKKTFFSFQRKKVR